MKWLTWAAYLDKHLDMCVYIQMKVLPFFATNIL